MESIKTLFFILIFLVVYSYIIYPLVLYILGYFFENKIQYGNKRPFVTIIISAYNEEKIIAKKIDNTLSLDYPANSFEILVVSDNSSDKTDDIINAYSDKGVVLISSSVRRGKTAGLNEAVEKAKGEIIVFTDADAMFPVDTLCNMLNLFADQNIGLVTGSTQYVSESNEDIVETSSIYTKLEYMTKVLESRIGSCVGADGAIFAMKKSLYIPLKDDDINDLVIPLKVVMQKQRVIIGENIKCIEAASSTSGSEFSRQIRITNRTLRALFRHIALLNFFKYPLFSFEILSHKIIRLSVPFFLILLIPLNILLIGEGIIYSIILTGQILFYSLALLGCYQEIRYKTQNRITIIYHFVLVQLSILIGWFKYLTGNNQVTWNPRN
ncbi:MAG: glycosyltransferase family 2 protein [Gammaproteobacteria bacterium]|nr:glycosyltransferase family 2 protein [Gammaproteobacteria bacterium]